MSIDQAFDPSLLIFAALALFVLWKLRSVLGERTERDQSAPSRVQPVSAASGSENAPGNVIAPAAFQPPPAERWTGIAEKDSKAWAGLDAVAAADAGFSGPAFIEGARKAYEMIIAAFAKGDRETLGRLLSPHVFENFAAEISARELRGETLESALVSIDSAMVEDASASADLNSVTVRFASKLISARRDKDGQLIEGSPEHTIPTVDLWTFARNPKAQDPNWKLVATETAS